MFRQLALIFLINSLLLVAACSVNPVTGEKQFSLVSAEQEISIGSQQYQPSQQAQGGPYYLDPEIQLYVAGIGKKLAAVSDQPNLPYEFVVINNAVPNAWALPGGKIAINRGLLTHLQDESELAAVLSHEIVHAAARHSAAQMTRGTLINIGAQALGAASQSNGFGELGGMAAQFGSAAWMASYGREAELESDAYGMEYMVRAGYDPDGAVKLQETFVKLSKNRQSDFLSGLFASHPPSQARVTANKAKAQSYPPGGIINRALYQKKMAQLQKDQAAYQAQEEAIKALQNKSAQNALNHLDQAIKLQPREGQFWELRGHAWSLLKESANADNAFSTAIAKNPNYFSHYLARGLLRYKEGKATEANQDLTQSYQLLPTPEASLYLGNIASDEGDQKTALNHYRQAAQAKNEIGQQAENKLALIEMATAPNRYILNRLSLNNEGYLMLSVYNKSSIDAEAIVVQLTEFVSGSITGSSVQLPIGNLKAGAQTTINTRIGPFKNASTLDRHRALIIKARPVKPAM